MKHFEVYIEGKWLAFQSTEKVTISKKAGVVTIVQEETPAGRLKTVFNLSVLPVYSFA